MLTTRSLARHFHSTGSQASETGSCTLSSNAKEISPVNIRGVVHAATTYAVATDPARCNVPRRTSSISYLESNTGCKRLLDKDNERRHSKILWLRPVLNKKRKSHTAKGPRTRTGNQAIVSFRTPSLPTLPLCGFESPSTPFPLLLPITISVRNSSAKTPMRSSRLRIENETHTSFNSSGDPLEATTTVRWRPINDSTSGNRASVPVQNLDAKAFEKMNSAGKTLSLMEVPICSCVESMDGFVLIIGFNWLDQPVCFALPSFRTTKERINTLLFIFGVKKNETETEHESLYKTRLQFPLY
ncbi:hypothetical protein BU17DRAFT_62644 [Hysterangium stoloniferum]|nr:hypothetical protein BU17DRAFT_62644 [Hysterangium stoloniferum]